MSRFSGLDVGPDGLVYITWVTFTSKTLYLSRYDPTSGSIAGPFNVQHLTTGSLMAGQIHSVAVDKTQPETVYVAYEDAPNSATKLDIWLTKSTDRGGSWSTPRKANWDDSTPTDQYLPWITTTKASSSNGIGRVDLVFYDKRNDPTFNSAYDVYLATSADRGETFQANIRVSDIPSSTTDYLDYIGMTSRPKDARPVWTGQRTVSAADSDILTDKQAFQDLDVRSSLTSGAQIASPGPAVSVDNSADGYLPTEVTFSLTPTPSSHIIRAVSCSQNPSNTMRVFDHWAYDSSFANVVVNSNSITGSLTGDSVLTAYYRETSGTCPSSTLSAGFSYTPSNPVQYYCVTFASTTTGGTTPYSYSWSFGDINPTIDSSTCHGGNTSNVGHSYASPGSYIVTLTVTDSSAAVSTHSQTVSIASGGQGSGGLITRNSPYISTYDGNLWHLDNNLIPQSLYPNHPSGTGVIDSYKIQQPIASTSGTYSLRVDELGLDQAYLDRVSLVTVDHDSSVNLGVSPDGQLLTYGNPYSPVSAASSQGLDVSATVRGLDGIYYQGYPGDWVNVDFAERLDLSLGAKLVVRYSSIDRAPTAVQVMTSIEQWSNVTLLTPRTFWSTGIVDLKTFLPDAQGKSRVRILLASYQRIDYVGLDVTPQATMAVQQAGLVKAVNSYGLDVTPTLQASDDQQVELLPGQGISLTFATPTTSPVGNRDFIITIEGYYVELA